MGAATTSWWLATRPAAWSWWIASTACSSAVEGHEVVMVWPVALAAGAIVAAAITSKASPAAITSVVVGIVQYSAGLFHHALQVRNQIFDGMFDRMFD